MLVLQRDLDQRLIFDLSEYGIKETFSILITRVRGNHVWLGIEAAREVKVYREELLEQGHGK